MCTELWQHTPTQDRYIVLVRGGVVESAAGPLTGEQLAAIQRDEWRIPWRRGLGAWVQARRAEFGQGDVRDSLG